MVFILKFLLTLTSWWAIEGGSISTHLRLEPAGSSHSFFTGDNFFVTCLSREESSATRLTWQGPSGKDITNSHGRVHVAPAPNNPLGLQLVVEEARFKDQGIYTCSAIVDRAEVRTRFSMSVYQSIGFLGTPREQHGVEDKDFLIVCKVRSDPPAIVTWYVNDTLITNGHRRTITDDGLYIRHLQRSDSGNYTCRAFVVTQYSSQMKDIHIRFDVHYRPVWRNPSMDIAYGFVGGTTHLVCEAHAKPSPIFEWYRERALLGNSRNYRISNHKWKSILQVKITDNSAFGNYRCVASNHLGEAKKSIALFEGVFPRPPSIAVNNDQPGYVLVNLKPSAKDTLPVLGYRLQCRLFDEDWRKSKEYHVYGKHEILLQDLSFKTTYVLRARTRNAVGYGNYSEEITLRTKDIIAETVKHDPSLSSSSNNNNSSACSVIRHFPDSGFLIIILVVIVQMAVRRLMVERIQINI